MRNRLCKCRGDVIIYIIIFLLFYALNLYSPFINDDYYYSFIMSDGLYGDKEYIPIDSLKDVWESQSWAYINHNGRFIVHSIVQLFCGILGLRLFQLSNAAIFTLLIIGIARIIRYRYNIKTSLEILLPTWLIFVAIPMIGMTYLGNISCSVNYLWTSCAVIWFFYFLLKQEFSSKLCAISLVIYSFIVGSMQESFSIGISAILGIYVFVKWKDMKSIRKLMILGFILGALVCACAPSNFVRFASGQGGVYSFTKVICQCLRVGLSLRMFWLMLILVIGVILSSREKLKNISSECWMIIGVCIVNILFAALVAMTGKHQLVSIELFSIIAIINLVYDKCLDLVEKKLAIVIPILTILFVSFYIPAYYCRKIINDGLQLIINEAKDTKFAVVGKEYEKLCVSDNWFVVRYTRQDLFYDFNKRGLSLLLTKGKNINYIAAVLPEEESVIVSICKPENMVAKGVYKDDLHLFYVVRIPSENKDKLQYRIGLKPGIIGGFFYKLVYESNGGVDEGYGWVRDCNSFDLNGYTYAIVQDSSPIEMVDLVNVDI